MTHSAHLDTAVRPGTVVVRAPAKVNVHLGVGPRRADGYHDLATVFMALSLYDEVHARPADRGDQGFTVAMDTDSTAVVLDAVPLDDSNIVVQAAKALASHAGVDRGAHLTVTKRIPVAAGLAGGSADAAATLVALDALWEVGASQEELLTLAAQLGADVPFCLQGHLAVGTGRGDELSPVLARAQSFHWVLAVSTESLSTPSVYAEFDRLTAHDAVEDPDVPECVVKALRSGDPELLGRVLTNDLQQAAVSLLPGLQSLLNAGKTAGALGQIVSGSGPTVAFLARDADHALDLAVFLAATGDVRSLERAHGPVAGARVVTTSR